ncbi:MAG: helix-turn-helix domain-containing protein [Odoribacter sp.]|nr:helix-turn-helix domain-containing protein [Odoribacter sp.]
MKRKKEYYIIDDHYHIGSNIKKIRLLLELSQNTVAFSLGVKQQYLSKIEKKKNIEKYWVEKIAHVLQVEIKDILEFDANNPEKIASVMKKRKATQS